MKKIAKKLQIKKEDISLMVIIYFIFFVNGILNTGIGSIIPYMKDEYNIDYFLSGLVQSSYQIGSLIMVILSGFLPYIIGRKKSTTYLFLGAIIGMFILTITGNKLALVIAFGLIGLTKGMISNIGNVTISEISGSPSKSLNVLHAIFAVGSFITPIIVIISSKPFGWKGFPIFVAIISLVCLVLSWNSKLPLEPDIKTKNSGDLSFLKSKPFWINTFILFFYLCSESALIGWLVIYFKDTGLLSESLAQITLSILWIMIMVGRFIFALIADKVSKDIALVVSAGLQIVFFLLMIAIQSPVIIVIAIMGLGFSTSIIYPTVLSTMDPKYSSSTIATGTIIAVSTLGAVIMPLVIGYVSDIKGVKGGMATLSVALVSLLVLTIVKVFYEKNKK